MPDDATRSQPGSCTAAEERGHILARARQWKKAGLLTDAEHGAICAVVLLSDEPPTDEDIRRGQELAEEHGW